MAKEYEEEGLHAVDPKGAKRNANFFFAPFGYWRETCVLIPYVSI
jgi:hypothetical protein